MDAQVILDIIIADARQTAEQTLREAQDRVLTIHEESDMRTSQEREDTKKRAQKEAAQMMDRMERLALLEDRKDQLEAKRMLIDRAFDHALETLRNLPPQEFGDVILGLILQNAAGDETLAAGSISDSFFTPEFINKANDALMKSGRLGRLSDSGLKITNISGLVLKTPQSELYCTIEALLHDQRESLEPAVASVLFPEKTL